MNDKDDANPRPKVVGSLPGKAPWTGRPRQFPDLRMMSLKLEAEMLQRLRERAAAEETTVSELCRYLLGKGLDEHRPESGD